MYKEVLRAIDGISTFPIISLGLFVLFFDLLLLWVTKFDKETIKEMAAMPFDNNTSTTNIETVENE